MQHKMNNAKWVLAILVLGVAELVMSLHQTKLSRPKIVDGHEVEINSIPFQLSLHIIRKGISGICGATIISATWGISAAHCFLVPNTTVDIDYLLKVTTVRSGSSQLNTGGYVHRLKDLYFYESSTEFYPVISVPKHDIILFKVTPKFRFSYNTKPAKLPHVGSTSPEWLQVSGWGRTKTSFSGTKFMRAANVSKLEWQECIRVGDIYRNDVIKDRNLCYGRGGADSCTGDSGGPLADSDTIYGIVSWGAGCGVEPGVYTDVSYYRQWIKKITNV